MSGFRRLGLTAAVFDKNDKNKVYFSDTFSKSLSHQGATLYYFALAQSRAFKG